MVLVTALYFTKNVPQIVVGLAVTFKTAVPPPEAKINPNRTKRKTRLPY